jgi:hypothetical protein
MKQFPILFIGALLWAAPASPLNALPASTIFLAEETLSDATVQQVLDAAAPLVGESSASLYARYQAGSVTITDLGPIRGGYTYRVSSGDTIIIVDLVGG